MYLIRTYTISVTKYVMQNYLECCTRHIEVLISFVMDDDINSLSSTALTKYVLLVQIQNYIRNYENLRQILTHHGLLSPKGPICHKIWRNIYLNKQKGSRVYLVYIVTTECSP